MTLYELFRLIKKHLLLVVLFPVVCAVAMGVVSYGFMSNVYTAETSLYVLARQGDENTANLQTSLSASQLIANDVAALINSNRVIADTVSDLGLEDLSGYDISVSSQTTNRVIELFVEGEDPRLAADIANAMAANVSEVAREVMDVQSINVVDKAATPTNPSGPKRAMYVAVAFLAGLFIAIAIIVLKDMLNTRIRSAEDAEELLGVPVIGRIPAFKGGN